jgi:hypothetical protein
MAQSFSRGCRTTDRPQIVDYLNYRGIAPDNSYGDLPDAQPFFRQSLQLPTPRAANTDAAGLIQVKINEWMADNSSALRDPADNNYEDWFELYNAGPSTADLGDYYLTDTLTNKFKFRVPNNGHYRIPPDGYLLVWADDETGQNDTNRADLHVNFKLDKAGEAIGLFAADGTQIDAVTFGPQTNNISQGRFPTGAADIFFLPSPTPRAANADPNPGAPEIVSSSLVDSTHISFTVTSIPGRTYRAEFKTDLQTPTWTPLGSSVTASGSTVSFSDLIIGGSQRFYRVQSGP